MVCALLEGRKTQTRRVIKAPTTQGDFVLSINDGVPEYNFGPDDLKPNGRLRWHRCPYGQPVDLLWVRETFFCATGEPGRAVYRYRARDDSGHFEGLWRPSIFMPRQASRLTLRVTGVRIERLQAIGQGDACAEGAPAPHEPIGWYSELWDSINGAKAWELNPWVWVVEFQVFKANVDQVLRDAA